jgi:ADP-ribose pyrophosphatase
MKKILPHDAILIPDNAQKVFGGEIFDVYQWQQELFDGTYSTFEMIRRPDTVVIITVVEGKIVVLNEEQPHVGKRVNTPAGRVDSIDVSVLSAAKRELKEETGYIMKNWRLAHVYQPLFKIEWFVHVFIAWDIKSIVDTQLDAGEKIQVALADFDKILKLSQEGDGSFGEILGVLEGGSSVDGLVSMPEFVGQTVDR